VQKNLSTLQGSLQNVRNEIGEIHVTGEPAGAEVWVNGRQVGRLPLQKPIRLDKGTAEIQLRAAGHVTAAETLILTGGRKESRNFRLEREPRAAMSATPPDVVAQTGAPVARTGAPESATAPTGIDSGNGERPRRLQTLAWVAAGLAVAGLGYGTFETFIALQRRNDFNNHKAPNATGELVADCNTTYLSTGCRPLKEAYDRAVTRAVIGYVAGGALAIGSTILFVMSAKERPGSTAALGCAPTLATLGLACRLSF
jgi:hypothetical protein